MDVLGINDEAFRDSVSHIDEEGHRVFFHPKQPKGKYYSWRAYLSYAYLTVFFSLPFIRVHGSPLFLFNVIERKFILFGVRFWPQDFFIFVLGMLIFIVFIALFTVVYGRVFCGWVCPQTVFMEMVFRRIEYWIDGNQHEQRALSKSPMNALKMRKRVLKIVLFFLIAFIVANTFLAYLIGTDELWEIATGKFSEHIGGFVAIIIFSGVFFFVFYWFREQACLVVCPYGRMQGVLLDKHSIVVAYDNKRGEQRHKYAKEKETGIGDCIDCFECVRVCPTGIDIRNGTQLECTNCTACIDACDHMMESVHRPKGLVRYASEFTIRTGKRLRWTGRMLAYTAILFVLIGLESFLLVTRSDLDVTVNRARGQIFNRQEDGKVNNIYSFKVINKTRNDMPIELRVSGMEVKMLSGNLIAKADSLITGSFFLLMPEEEIVKRKYDLEVEWWSEGKLMKKEKTTFIGPATGSSKQK